MNSDTKNLNKVEYMGSKIIVSGFEEGETIRLKMEESLKDRQYQTLDFYFENSQGEIISREDKIEGFFLLKHRYGDKLYTYEQGIDKWNRIKGFKFYSTSHDIKLFMKAKGGDNIPSEMIIEGYYKTYDINTKIKVSFDMVRGDDLSYEKIHKEN